MFMPHMPDWHMPEPHMPAPQFSLGFVEAADPDLAANVEY